MKVFNKAEIPTKLQPVNVIVAVILCICRLFWPLKELSKSGSGEVRFDGDPLTHGSWEDDDSQDIHALACAGDNLILYVRCRGDFQEHWVTQLRVVVVGHDVHIVDLRLFFIRILNYWHQICPILEWKKHQRHVKKIINTIKISTKLAVLFYPLTCWKVASIRLDGIMFLEKKENT